MLLCVTLNCHAQNFLLKARRSQEAPFNLSCPYYKYPDGHLSENPCVVGCVATAVEHIMNYWKTPAQTFAEIPEYTTDNYSLPAIPAGTEIDWNNMQEDYLDSPYTDASAKAVADLSLYIGQALRMKYGEHSSGVSTSNVPDVVKNVFGYKTVYLCYRGDYTIEKWERLLQNEFEQGRPVYYSGHTFFGNGHAWVLDGYDPKTGLYHNRWDENNNRDKWYSLDFLNEFENECDNVPGDEFFGCSANNYCVIISPDDADLSLALDTIPYNELKETTGHLYGVEVLDVKFLRPLSTDNVVLAEVTLRNHSSYHFQYTAEALVSPKPSEDFIEEARFSSMFAANLMPFRDTTITVPLSMPLSGEVYFAITPDEEQLYCYQKINVSKSHLPQLAYEEPEITFPEPGVAEIRTVVHNQDDTNYNGNYFYHWLMPHDEALYGSDGNTQSVRYSIVNIPPSMDTTLVARFHQLEVGETYQLWLRQNWTPIVKTLDFTVPDVPSSIKNLQYKNIADTDNTYDLSGRIVRPRLGEIFIKNRRRYIK